MQDATEHNWPGKSDGVPPPPTKAGVDEVSSQQGMITDEWAPLPAHPDQHSVDPEAAKDQAGE